MIEFRKFCENDVDIILNKWVGNSCVVSRSEISKADVISTINRWNTGIYNGSYYGMFAIVENNEPVGSVSLFERENSISVGIEVLAPYRKNGYATAAVEFACKKAKEMGYKKIISQVRTDNAASIRLHEKCGIVFINKIINRKGNEVYIGEKLL